MTAIDSTTASVEILNSWKEIANYLSRGVRTVQRWEADLGMPVRRPRGKGRSAVIAIRSELDQWIKSCPLETQPGSIVLQTATNTVLMLDRLRAATYELQRRRSEVNYSRKQLSVALSELSANVRKVASASWGGVRVATIPVQPPEGPTAA